jgi:hypothetical protein
LHRDVFGRHRRLVAMRGVAIRNAGASGVAGRDSRSGPHVMSSGSPLRTRAMIYFMCHPICGWIAGATTMRRSGAATRAASRTEQGPDVSVETGES